MCRSTGRSVTNNVRLEDANWLLSLAGLPNSEKMSPLDRRLGQQEFLVDLADGSKVVQGMVCK